MIQATVYLLCLLTSGICASLLVRSYRQTGTRLLLYSAACFVLLALIDVPREELTAVYLLRLAAFTLIIGAILFKNIKIGRNMQHAHTRRVHERAEQQ